MEDSLEKYKYVSQSPNSPLTNKINCPKSESQITKSDNTEITHNSQTAPGNKSISLNLMKKFDKVKVKNSKKLSEEELLNEMTNKINLKKQMINMKEELNVIYSIEVQNFVDFFIGIFDEISRSIETNKFEIIQIFSTVKDLIIMGKDDTNDQINYLFRELEEKLNIQLGDRISQLIEKLNKIKSFALNNQIRIYTKGSESLTRRHSSFNRRSSITSQKDSSNVINNISELSNKKLKNMNKESDILLDTVYMKKSKSKWGVNDDVEINQGNNTQDYSRKMKKTKKLFLRNFMQIFLMKDRGIFSESFFSKIDKSLLNSYKNFKFYEIKFYFSLEESYRDITDYISKLRNLFPRYLMLYKEIHKNKFLKITICGVGKKQSLMKRILINIMSGNVKHDCLFKISLFSNIFDALSDSLKKIDRNRNYFYFTNFKMTTLTKIIKKIYSLNTN